jgi:hypothetical protein
MPGAPEALSKGMTIAVSLALAGLCAHTGPAAQSKRTRLRAHDEARFKTLQL